MLLVFAVVGVAHVINPTWFVKRSGVRKGGELLTEINMIGFQIAGAVFAAFSLYLLYVLISN
jgi:hypothetical protein